MVRYGWFHEILGEQKQGWCYKRKAAHFGDLPLKDLYSLLLSAPLRSQFWALTLHSLPTTPETSLLCDVVTFSDSWIREGRNVQGFSLGQQGLF